MKTAGAGPAVFSDLRDQKYRKATVLVVTCLMLMVFSSCKKVKEKLHLLSQASSHRPSAEYMWLSDTAIHLPRYEITVLNWN